MKRALTTLGILMGCVLAIDASAQVTAPPDDQKYFRVPYKYLIYVDFSGALPLAPGEFNDYWNSAFQFGVGGGMSIFTWLEVNGNFGYASWDNNSTLSKVKIGYTGVPEVEGGLLTTMSFTGSARFIAAPSLRTNPYAEVGVGYYKTTAEDITIEDAFDAVVLDNSMEPTSGMVVSLAAGVQYTLNESWGAYAKYTYVTCFSDTFAPGDLLLPVGGGEPVDGTNQVYSTIGVGIMLRI
jgi:Outer membrane protein beta-barrel domain